MSSLDVGMIIIIILALGGVGWAWRDPARRDFYGGLPAICIVIIALLVLLKKVFVPG